MNKELIKYENGKYYILVAEEDCANWIETSETMFDYLKQNGARVLFDKPSEDLKEWVKYKKYGGDMLLKDQPTFDITNEDIKRAFENNEFNHFTMDLANLIDYDQIEQKHSEMTVDTVIDIYNGKYRDYEFYIECMKRYNETVYRLNNEQFEFGKKVDKLTFTHYLKQPIIDRNTFDYIMEKGKNDERTKNNNR